MPTYAYQCNDCRTEFQVNESITTHARRRPVCPKCKGRDVQQVLSASYVKTIRKS